MEWVPFIHPSFLLTIVNPGKAILNGGGESLEHVNMGTEGGSHGEGSEGYIQEKDF